MQRQVLIVCALAVACKDRQPSPVVVPDDAGAPVVTVTVDAPIEALRFVGDAVVRIRTTAGERAYHAATGAPHDPVDEPATAAAGRIDGSRLMLAVSAPEDAARIEYELDAGAPIALARRSRTGAHLLVVAGETLRVHDASTLRRRAALPVGDTFALSDAGNTVAVAEGDTVMIRRVPTFQLLREVPAGAAAHLALSASGTHLALADAMRVRILPTGGDGTVAEQATTAPDRPAPPDAAVETPVAAAVAGWLEARAGATAAAGAIEARGERPALVRFPLWELRDGRARAWTVALPLTWQGGVAQPGEARLRPLQWRGGLEVEEALCAREGAEIACAARVRNASAVPLPLVLEVRAVRATERSLVVAPAPQAIPAGVTARVHVTTGAPAEVANVAFLVVSLHRAGGVAKSLHAL